MSKRTYINEDLLRLIAHFKDREFTIPLLRDAYLETSVDKSRSIKAVQHSIYKTLLKLEAKGEITRIPKKFGRTDAYIWNINPAQNDLDVEADATKNQPATTTMRNHHSLLNTRLTQHKSDLIAAIGEADEYEALCAEFPEMASDLQQRYNASRDTISTLLGKIRALESVLSERPSR